MRVYVGEVQGLGAHAAVRIDHPIPGEAQDGLVLPDSQVAQILPGLVVGLGDGLSASPADIPLAGTFQGNPHEADR